MLQKIQRFYLTQNESLQILNDIIFISFHWFISFIERTENWKMIRGFIFITVLENLSTSDQHASSNYNTYMIL